MNTGRHSLNSKRGGNLFPLYSLPVSRRGGGGGGGGGEEGGGGRKGAGGGSDQESGHGRRRHCARAASCAT